MLSSSIGKGRAYLCHHLSCSCSLPVVSLQVFSYSSLFFNELKKILGHLLEAPGQALGWATTPSMIKAVSTQPEVRFPFGKLYRIWGIGIGQWPQTVFLFSFRTVHCLFLDHSWARAFNQCADYQVIWSPNSKVWLVWFDWEDNRLDENWLHCKGTGEKAISPLSFPISWAKPSGLSIRLLWFVFSSTALLPSPHISKNIKMYQIWISILFYLIFVISIFVAF